MKSFPNDGFYDLSELRGWVTSRARLPTLGSRLVILIEFYIAPKDSQDLRQEVGGVAQERLLRSGKCSKTQVGHSGQGPVTAHLSLRATVTQGNSPSPSSPPATWSALTQRGTDSAPGSFSTQQHSNPARGRYCKQTWTGTWEEIHFPILTEETVVLFISFSPRRRLWK